MHALENFLADYDVAAINKAAEILNK